MISSIAIRVGLGAMLALATVATPVLAATQTTTKMEIFPRDPSFGDPVIVEFEAATDTGQRPDALISLYVNDTLTLRQSEMDSLNTRGHVSVGARSSCTVTSSGAAACWGDGVHGQLGRGSTTGAALPVPMTGFSTHVRAVASGEDFNCLLTEAGSAWCTGRNDRGQLGDDSLVDRSTPVQVFGLNAGVRLLASGGALSCAVKGDSQYTCWGDGDTRPSSLATLPAPIKSITVGYRICVLTVDLDVYCANPARDSLGNRGVMTKVAGLPSGIISVAAGKSHVCALHPGAAPNTGLWCWGSNAQGQFGNGTTSLTSSDALVQVQLPPSTINSGKMMLVTAGDGHTCITGHQPWCAGTMGSAPNGYENGSTFRSFWTDLNKVVGVASGGLSACVINSLGRLNCTGDAANNKLGSLADTIARRVLAGSAVYNGFTHFQVPAGTQTFKAQLSNFNGSSQYIESSVSKDIKVFAKTSVTLTAAQNPIVYAEPIVLTAQVIGNDGSIPSGQVAFYRDNVIAATIALDETGQAVFNETVRNPGTRPYSAHYLGAEPWRTSSGHLELIVNRIPATLSLALLTASPVIGKPVKVKITGTTTGQPPSGPVQYSIRGVPGTQIGTMTNGAMEISFTPSVHGAHDIQISFAPTAVYEGQTARLTVIVKDKPTVTVKANTPTVRTGDLMSYTITVRGSDGAPSGGEYELYEDGRGVDSDTLDANGTLTKAYRSNHAGSHQLIARYYGSSTQEPATSAPAPIFISNADVTISTPNIPPLQRFGTPLSFEVTWKENSWWTYGGEQVTLELNGKPHSTVDIDYTTGKAKFKLPKGLPFGTHQIAVTYTPGDNGLNPARSATVTASADYKLGTQQRVNTGVAGHQSSPAIATSRTGGGMVVWISKPTAAMPGGVTARLIGTDGLPTGSDIAVSTPSQTVGSDQFPAVAALTGGGYVVAWQSAQRIYFRLYTSTGTPTGKRIGVPVTGSAPRWQRPAVVATPDGGFAIGWYSAGAAVGQQFIYITRFDKSGTPLRSRLQIAAITGQILAVDAPALAVLNGTGDVVAGFATGSSTKGYLRLQRASPTALIGTAVSIPSDAGQALQPLTVGRIGASKVAAVWTSPAGSNSLKWMSYSSTLTAPSAVQTLAKNVVLSSGPSVTTINVGELAVAWTGYDTAGMGTFVQLLDATGKPSGGIGTINTTLDANQTDPALATLFTAGKPSKTWVAVWTHTPAALQGDIHLQRFAAP